MAEWLVSGKQISPYSDILAHKTYCYDSGACVEPLDRRESHVVIAGTVPCNLNAVRDNLHIVRISTVLSRHCITVTV